MDYEHLDFDLLSIQLLYYLVELFSLYFFLFTHFDYKFYLSEALTFCC